MTKTWDDKYAKGGKRYGERCISMHKGYQCVLNSKHKGRYHRDFDKDGHVVSWEEIFPHS